MVSMRAKRVWGIVYLGLLAVSGIWKTFFPFSISPMPEQESVTVSIDESANSEVEIRFLDTKREIPDSRPSIVLLHGSPMASSTFDTLLPHLSDKYRLIVPDLPGFGRSQRSISDYSITAHGLYLEKLLDELQVTECHLVGYSMGGGVAVELCDSRPDLVKSLTLVSSIGLQEYELLGDYTLNHALHAAQLFGFWALDWVVPHFGYFDRVLLNYRYARNFYDTDQRPLREAMLAWEKPVLIVHGDQDGLVPYDAAIAHRIVMPQSRLATYEDAGHLAIYRQPERFGRDLSRFVDDVEIGAAAHREGSALVDELAARGMQRSGVFMATLLGISTFVSEDLACIGGGLLATKGTIPLHVAIIGCLLGIFLGDFFIYLLGRVLGRSGLELPVIRRLMNQDRVDGIARWLDEKGLAWIVSTRFIPGSRVPTYFVAGVVKANAFRFAFALLLGAAIWTPAIVGLSYIMGGAFLEFFDQYEGWALWGLLISSLAILTLVRLAAGLFSWRGRRMLYSRFKRTIRWEYWPMWLFYPPIIGFVLWKMVRHRSITMLTAVNPCMPASGLVYESKGDILSHLQKFGSPVGLFEVIPLEWDLEKKKTCLRGFMRDQSLSYPVVLKPDVGQRGQGVEVISSEEEAMRFFEAQKEDTVAQEFLPGREYGVFYYRYPNEEKGRVFSITDKRLMRVTGNGQSTLERLILTDERAVGMAKFFLEAYRQDLERVIPEGEVYSLTELGTHCRGALFLDGEGLMTPELEEAVDAMSREVEGFHFGRYDIRVPSEADLMAGRNLRIIELNGLTSESTNIYDPKHSLFFAYRTLIEQFRIAFGIAEASIGVGNRPDGLRETFRLIIRYALGKPSDRK
jgi:pimeloyl-ACP methyl ester carboxylesterase/membrane protein DedA with SNARE-associated domain